MNTKYNIKLGLELLMHTVLRAFYLFPIKKNRVLFNANSGLTYSGNPKCIYEYLLSNSNEIYEASWVIKNPDVLPKGTKYVKIHSLKMMYIALTSKVLIADIAFPPYLPFRKKQVVINTWHGGGAYKKSGKDFVMSRASKHILDLASKHTSIFLSTNRCFSKVMSKSTGIPELKFWGIGMPREDILFHISAEQKQEIRERLHLSKDQKLVLYAPTFRSFSQENGIAVNFVDAEKCVSALEKRWPGDWIFAMRYHMAAKQGMERSCKWLDVTSYPDMQELLCVADVLITDYSSCMWDASLMKKPCFIMAPDIEQYISERGFYTEPAQWPYPIALTNDELADHIENFDQTTYEYALIKHHRALQITETGHATEIAADAILKLCYQNYTSEQILGLGVDLIYNY